MAALNQLAGLLLTQEPGRDERSASAADVPTMTHPSTKGQKQETADEYTRVLVQLNAERRVIECPKGLQYILQVRKKGGAERPWRGVGYFRTRGALLRVCASCCGLVGPSEMDLVAALPERVGGAGLFFGEGQG